MNRWMKRCAVPALASLAAVGIGLPAIAQSADNQKSERATRTQQTSEVQRAQRIAELVDEGQLKLRYATALAEQHTKGMALEVECHIQSGQTMKSIVGKSGAPPADTAKQSTGDRLIYEVTCFVDDHVQTVRVDGLTKQVDAAAGSQPKPQPKPMTESKPQP